MALFHRPLPRNLDAALRDLKEKSAIVRRSAMQDLGRHVQQNSPPRVVEALLAALRDEDPIVRTEAAYCLGDAKAREALPALLLAVDDTHSLVRQAAIDALGTIGDSRASGRLMRALDDDRPDVRFQAVVALARVSPESGLDAVLHAMKDEDHHVRYIAIRTAEEIGTKGDSAEFPIELPERITRCVEGWLEDEDAHVRLAAAILLGRCGKEAGAEELLCAIYDRIESLEPEDEAAAIDLAGRLGLQDAVPALEQRAFGLKRFLKERHAWASRVALARMGHDRARQAILHDLHAWSRERRTAAVTAAAQAGIREALDAIQAMRGDHEKAEQEAVDEALELLHALGARGGS
jgi:HEAT repeat protein